MGNRRITILCSGFGLGFYIPGLLVAQGFRQRGIDTEVLVFESYMEQEKIDHIPDSRAAYHRDFALANLSARLPMDIRKSIDDARVEQLLDRWEAEDRREFISLSGHWVYILDRYRERMQPRPIHADLLYVDSDLAPSWKSLKRYHPRYNEPYYDACLYDPDRLEIRCEVAVPAVSRRPYAEREARLVIHGGGWGMGTYRETIPALAESGYALDIVAYPDSQSPLDPRHRYLMNATDWCAWVKDAEGRHGFPPLWEIKDGETIRHAPRDDRHWMGDIVASAQAIVAKPGAGTLIDSLATATPVILLEPFGSHEQRNAELWEHLGYGMRYERWRESGYAPEALETMHRALQSRTTEGMDYVDRYCDRVHVDPALRIS